MKQWFSDMQKKVHVLGPLLPPGYGFETQNTEEGVSNDIAEFLKEMLERYGNRSVFFVRCFLHSGFQLHIFALGCFWLYALALRSRIH